LPAKELLLLKAGAACPPRAEALLKADLKPFFKFCPNFNIKSVQTRKQPNGLFSCLYVYTTKREPILKIIFRGNYGIGGRPP